MRTGVNVLFRAITHLHAGEVTAVGPSKPATVGALVDVHILQVDVHAYNTPATRRAAKKEYEQSDTSKRDDNIEMCRYVFNSNQKPWQREKMSRDGRCTIQ